MAHHFNFKAINAGVAELADALDLGSSAFGVGVRLPSPAPICGRSSVGRAQPCQGWGREFESRRPLQKIILALLAGVAELADAQDLKSCGR
jgi:hypothetical protein